VFGALTRDDDRQALDRAGLDGSSEEKARPCTHQPCQRRLQRHPFGYGDLFGT
jgi:hypothetical protein